MKNRALEESLSAEIMAHISARQSLMLASKDKDGEPYASYAPFAFDSDGFYVLLSDIALHGQNLAIHNTASVLVIEDEDGAAELFARKRVNFKVSAARITEDSEQWHEGINALTSRHGQRITQLSTLADFKLFHLAPMSGRYVKGFGKAYHLEGGSLTHISLNHLTDGHKRKAQPNLA